MSISMCYIPVCLGYTWCWIVGLWIRHFCVGLVGDILDWTNVTGWCNFELQNIVNRIFINKKFGYKCFVDWMVFWYYKFHGDTSFTARIVLCNKMTTEFLYGIINLILKWHFKRVLIYLWVMRDSRYLFGHTLVIVTKTCII